MRARAVCPHDGWQSLPPQKALAPPTTAKMLRVTKPGGRVACLEMSHPPSPIFGAAFHLYFDRVVPLLGRLIGRAFDAYSYLPTSVSTFPDAPHLKRIMEEAGWREVTYDYRAGGVVAIHAGVKPKD